jgi:hypothetical protein
MHTCVRKNYINQFHFSRTRLVKTKLTRKGEETGSLVGKLHSLLSKNP